MSVQELMSFSKPEYKKLLKAQLKQQAPNICANIKADDQEKETYDADESITLIKEIHKNSVSASYNYTVSANKTKKQEGSSTFRQYCFSNINPPCVCNGTLKNQNQIRCNFCQELFHERCVEVKRDDPIGFWTCPDCRKIPTLIKAMDKNFGVVSQNNTNLVQELKNKNDQIQILQSENDRLRSLIQQRVETHDD
ncbi:unnamed protein product [Mytilus coruscus]|uniref:PHD-type domain-containing protein n=1 Tax=Mytilus coruscus TaxID=42192 RepID=A0A6J8E3X7_MYTCO|nr:unnamed protein product [Mytilus coruscus]